MTRKRILQTNFTGAATAAGREAAATRATEHRTCDAADHAGKLPRLVLFAKVLQTLRVLVEHAPLGEHRLDDVAGLHLVQVQVEQLVPKSEPLGRGGVELG